MKCSIYMYSNFHITFYSWSFFLYHFFLMYITSTTQSLIVKRWNFFISFPSLYIIFVVFLSQFYFKMFYIFNLKYRIMIPLLLLWIDIAFFNIRVYPRWSWDEMRWDETRWDEMRSHCIIFLRCEMRMWILCHLKIKN